MSLIIDAVKTAQRERSAGSAAGADRRALEGFFPYAGSGAATTSRRSRSAVIAIGVMAGLVIIAGGGALMLRAKDARLRVAPDVPPRPISTTAPAPQQDFTPRATPSRLAPGKVRTAGLGAIADQLRGSAHRPRMRFHQRKTLVDKAYSVAVIAKHRAK